MRTITFFSLSLFKLALFSCSNSTNETTSVPWTLYCTEVNKYSVQSCENMGDYTFVKASAHVYQEKYLISLISKEEFGLAQLSYLDTLYNFNAENYLDLDKEILAMKTFKMKLSLEEMNQIVNQINTIQNYDSAFHKLILDASYYYVKTPNELKVGLEGYEFQEYHKLDSVLHSLVINPIQESLVPWINRIPKEF